MSNRIYDWPEEIVIDALHHLTHTTCGGYDDDFMTDCVIQAFYNPAWAACAVMDYIDNVLGSRLDKITTKAM